MGKDRIDRIDALIVNDQSTFGEDDREFLEGLDDKSFESVEGIAAKYHAKHLAEVESLTANASTDDVTIETYIANAPGEIREVLTEGVATLQRERRELTGAILENCKVFTEDQLKDKGMIELRQIAQLANIKTPDFSGRGAGEGVPNHNERQPDGSGVPPAPTVNDLVPAAKAG